MSVVTFEDYTPLPRYDGLPWTHLTIDESPTSEGSNWIPIDTIALDPVDDDPEHPMIRNFTTHNATLEDGWYRVTFWDAGNNSANPTPAIHQSKSADYAPSLTKVARHILSRTRDTFGNQLGTFTADTQPTGLQAQAIIQDATTSVADEVGDEIPPELFDDAASVVALRAAMQIELDFYAEQISSNRSPYPQLKELYDEELARLQKSVTEAIGGGGLAVDTGPSNRPSYSFPDPYFTLGRRW